MTLEVTGSSSPDTQEAASGASATVTVNDDDDPVVTMEVDTSPLRESTEFNYTFRREGVLDDALVIERDDWDRAFWCPDAAPSPGQCGTAQESSVTIPAGQATTSFPYTIFDGNLFRPGMKFMLKIRPRAGRYALPPTLPAGAVAAESDAAETVYRFDIREENLGKLSISPVDAVVDESESACYELDLEDSANEWLLSAIDVKIAVTDSGDMLDSTQDAELNLSVSSLPHRFCVSLDDDSSGEANAEISAEIVEISDSAIQVKPGSGTAAVTARDNDLPVITMTTSATSAPEGGAVTVTLTRSGDDTNAFTVQAENFGYWTERGILSKTVTTRSVTFSAGQSSVEVALPVVDDDNDYHVTSIFLRRTEHGQREARRNGAGAIFQPPRNSLRPEPLATADSTRYKLEMSRERQGLIYWSWPAHVNNSPVTAVVEGADDVCFEVTSRALDLGLATRTSESNSTTPSRKSANS